MQVVPSVVLPMMNREGAPSEVAVEQADGDAPQPSVELFADVFLQSDPDVEKAEKPAPAPKTELAETDLPNAPDTQTSGVRVDIDKAAPLPADLRNITPQKVANVMRDLPMDIVERAGLAPVPIETSRTPSDPMAHTNDRTKSSSALLLGSEIITSKPAQVSKSIDETGNGNPNGNAANALLSDAPTDEPLSTFVRKVGADKGQPEQVKRSEIRTHVGQSLPEPQVSNSKIRDHIVPAVPSVNPAVPHKSTESIQPPHGVPSSVVENKSEQGFTTNVSAVENKLMVDTQIRPNLGVQARAEPSKTIARAREISPLTVNQPQTIVSAKIADAAPALNQNAKRQTERLQQPDATRRVSVETPAQTQVEGKFTDADQTTIPSKLKSDVGGVQNAKPRSDVPIVPAPHAGLVPAQVDLPLDNAVSQVQKVEKTLKAPPLSSPLLPLQNKTLQTSKQSGDELNVQIKQTQNPASVTPRSSSKQIQEPFAIPATATPSAVSISELVQRANVPAFPTIMTAQSNPIDIGGVPVELPSKLEGNIRARNSGMSTPVLYAPTSPAAIQPQHMNALGSIGFTPIPTNQILDAESKEPKIEIGLGSTMATEEIVAQQIKTTPNLARPALADHVIRQIADAMRGQTGSGAVQIELDPIELGRVRLSLSASETGLTLMVLTDRADTNDLLRRNIEQLAQDFRELGHENLTFSFGQSAHREHPDPSEANTERSQGDGSDIQNGIAVTEAVYPIQKTGPSTGLDIRL